jgi:FkbM family methyltransferase
LNRHAMPPSATLAHALARVLDRLPGTESALEALPFPVRFADGERRRATLGAARMHRFWLSHPDLVRESQSALDAYEGGDAIDVGAFHGWYTLLLGSKARQGDRLVSVEPDVAAFPALLRTLAAAGDALPGVHTWALSSAVGDGTPIEVTWPDGPEGHPRFASGGAGGDPTITIDGLVQTTGLRPRFVKIDVEGAEWFVVQGMRATLRDHRPIVLLEVHPRWQPRPGTIAEIESVLRDARYDLEVLDRKDVAERQLWRPATAST